MPTVSELGVTIVPATSITAGGFFIITVTAEDASGDPVTGFTGTVQFTASDGEIPAPPVTFPGGSSSIVYTLADGLTKAGVWTITASVVGNPSIYGTSPPITVLGASASQVVFAAGYGPPRRRPACRGPKGP